MVRQLPSATFMTFVLSLGKIVFFANFLYFSDFEKTIHEHWQQYQNFKPVCNLIFCFQVFAELSDILTKYLHAYHHITITIFKNSILKSGQ